MASSGPSLLSVTFRWKKNEQKNDLVPWLAEDLTIVEPLAY